MQVSSSFKNIKHTPGIDEHIYEESEKLAKFFNGKFEVQWSCHLRNGVNITHVKLFGPHFEYFATAESGNLFKSINKATIKLQKQLQKKKSKLRNKINRNNLNSPKHTQILELQKVEEKEIEEYEDDLLDAA